MKEIFAKAQCERLEPANRLPAIISQNTLDAVLRLSKMTLDQLLQAPHNEKLILLKFGPDIVRIAAAKEVLRECDAWWAVDLYLDEADGYLRRQLREQYSNQTNFCDGDIYSKIRVYRKQRSEASRNNDMDAVRTYRFAEGRWWARLSASNQGILKQLFDKKHKKYVTELDAFLNFPALLAGDVTVDRALANNTEWINMTDRPTLRKLESRIPKFCKEDENMIRQGMSNRNSDEEEMSIDESFKEMFTDINQKDDEVLIQVQKYSLIPYPGEKDAGQSKPQPEKDITVWYTFATLAYQLGFESNKIQTLKSQDPDREKARAVLLGARNPNEFIYDEVLFARFQDEICSMCATATERSTATQLRFRTIDGGESIKRRSGRPLHINIIGNDFSPMLSGAQWRMTARGVTALSIRVSICNAYFGDCFSKISTNPLGPAFSISKPLNGMNATRDALQKLNDQIGALQEELDFTRRDKQSIDSKISNFRRGQIANFRSQLGDLESRMHNAARNASIVDKAKAQMQSRVRELEAGEKLQKEGLEKAKDEILSLQQSMVSVKNTNEALQQQLQDLRKTNGAVVQQRDYLEGKLHDYQAAQSIDDGNSQARIEALTIENTENTKRFAEEADENSKRKKRSLLSYEKLNATSLERRRNGFARLEAELKDIPQLDLHNGNQFQLHAENQEPGSMMEMGNQNESADTSPRSKVAWYHGDGNKKPDVQDMSLLEIKRLAKKCIRNRRFLFDRKTDRSLNPESVAESVKEGKELETVVVSSGDVKAINPPKGLVNSSTRNRPIIQLPEGHIQPTITEVV
ncbi:hypothetical protein TSTA_040450 [Talaromyces stipitatus ATCC 10500]|uniref:Uncharacterized protein n=1 Tax=Talaromyces stipitatus (strain ATCC 10500 / CBS 375.48 / QM 6759 / NRRL 1006) TaxID=441959 RepID=B8MI81_TALSN|nr:uncharacterized protein TSTA_040450 [Talaromyces stipitatus ATCC 10500]EED14565.1 hypothetical protein TSTA_040450 [Talaromyces stipitatus ATCC 10500]